MSKLEKFQRFIPGFYKPTTNTNVRGLLYAWSGEDDLIVEAIENAKEQLFVTDARLNYLDALGSNVGVFRPTAIGLADAQFRELIPALSFMPKQVKPTIQRILEVFFGVGNPMVAISESNPNEIVIQIPSSVPALRRTLKGSLHFHVCSGKILEVDNISKLVRVKIELDKIYPTDRLRGAHLGQGYKTLNILSNDGEYLQFDASTDLSQLDVTKSFMISNIPNYPGSFFPDETRNFSLTKQRGIIGQNIVAGELYPTLVMEDASGIPDAPGYVVFDFGNGLEESGIRYFGRPNNTTLLVDASYAFSKAHSIGSIVNVMVKPYVKPALNGEDISIYLVGVEAARILAQRIVESVLAAGIVVRWIVVEPRC
jgi:hypothetical protein